MMSIMSQRKAIAPQPIFGMQPVRLFSEETSEAPAEVPQERENHMKYADLKQEIFVQGFDDSMTQEALEEFFGKYGEIKKSKLLHKTERLNSKYWVALESPEAAEKCLAEIGAECEINGQAVQVALSVKQERKPRGQDKSKQTLFVGNLSWRVEDWQLEDFFMQFGEVE